MLTTVPSSMAIPEPRITVSSVSRPRCEWRSRRPASSSSGAAGSVPAGGTPYLLAQLVRGVRRRALRGQPVVDLLALGVAHQPDHVTGLRELEQGLQGVELGRVGLDVGHADAGRPGAQQGLELLGGAAAEVLLLVPDDDHVGVAGG